MGLNEVGFAIANSLVIADDELTQESNCDEWFDNLITKMDRTLDKVDLTKNVTFDNETNTTKVAISIVPEEDLEDFRYYQSIP